MNTLQLAARVRRHGVPTKLLVGQLDMIAPPAQVQRLGELNGWEVEVVPGAGHMVTLEQPRQWRDAVERFLAAA